jgi:hypothetical protein
MSQQTHTTPMVLADPVQLDDCGRGYMLGWLSSVIEFAPITREDWQKAYGRAADHQTVEAARTVLAQAVTS